MTTPRNVSRRHDEHDGSASRCCGSVSQPAVTTTVFWIGADGESRANCPVSIARAATATKPDAVWHGVRSQRDRLRTGG